jgi:murein DD-endopeptidase MepM/ murein hydrolase activator NlpD
MRTAPRTVLLAILTVTGSLVDAGCSADRNEADGDVDAGSIQPSDPATPDQGMADAAAANATDPDAAAMPEPCPRARVAVPAGSNLNVRGAPKTDGAVVASLPNNAVVPVLARVQGEAVSTNSEWLKVSAGTKEGFISSAFASCTTDVAPVLTKPEAFHLPLECDKTARISQGNNGTVSHSGKAQYAYDFAIPVNTPLVAIADGIVLYAFGETGPGDNCYNGGPASCYAYANYVVLRHGDGTGSIYKHLNKVLVTVGEFVPSGKPVGLSGSTGYSTGPHAHFMRQEICGAATSCQSVLVKFADVPGTGIPATGQTVTSKNACPKK